MLSARYFFSSFYYRQDLPHAGLTILFLLTGRFLGFFAPQGRHVAPIKVKFGMEALHAKFHLDRLRGRGLRFFITVLYLCVMCVCRISILYLLTARVGKFLPVSGNKNLAIANRSRVSCINTNNNTMTLKSGLEVTQGQ